MRITFDGLIPSDRQPSACCLRKGEALALHVEETGLKDAPSIVFLHGGGGAGWMWRPQVEALRGDFHLLVPDLPEQGRSANEGPFTMLSAAQQVADLIRARASGGRADVVGLSEGAQTLVQLLATAPELVRTGIVSSALVRSIPGTGWASNPAVLGFTYATSIAMLRGSDSWIRLNMRSAAGVPDAYFDDFRETFRTLSKSGFVDLMRANQTFRLPAGLEHVKARVLAVCGHREYEAMRRSTVDIAAAIPGACAYEVVHTRRLSLAQEHNWNMNEPELFNEMVRDFIAARPLPKALTPLDG
jgi:pimeloyl-ACP methyl ester carboxylesterase